MIHSFQELIDSTKNSNKRISVAVAQDSEVLHAVRNAMDLGMVSAVLVGDEAAIKAIAAEEGVSLDGMEIIDEPDKIEACRKAVKIAHDGEADIVMKGIVDTSVILKAVLDKEIGLRDQPVLSHVALSELKTFDRMMFITDAAMNISPDVEQKHGIIVNAVKVAHALGHEHPIVTCVCAVEKYNPKMPSTVDAAELVERNKRGEITGCTVCGPLALDNAVSVEAAKHKGIDDPNAGKSDILVVPSIEAGNILYKALNYMAHGKGAAIVVGAKVPIIVTSRADSDETKLNSIALAIAASR